MNRDRHKHRDINSNTKGGTDRDRGARPKAAPEVLARRRRLCAGARPKAAPEVLARRLRLCAATGPNRAAAAAGGGSWE